MEIVDEVGERAEDEQPSPHHEIKLDRVLLSLMVHSGSCGTDVCLCLCHSSLLPKIEKCKDEDPHEIDEMPIQAHDFDALVVALPAREEARRSSIIISPPDLAGNDEQE